MAKNTEDIAKEENVVLTFGNTTINSINLKGMTEEEFMNTYSRLISTGAKQALKSVRKYLKKNK